jgi:hypothetical protein
MEANIYMERQLWELIDGNLLPSERSVVEELIRTNAEWRNKYEELMEVNDLLHSSELDAPSLRFTKNVMEEITKLHIAPATKTYINKKIIFGIMSFFFLMIIGFLVYGIGLMRSAGDTENKISRNVPRFDYSIFFSNNWINAFMMVNMVVALFLLDNYLGKRRKEFRKESL